jgi:hypothetical protein
MRYFSTVFVFVLFIINIAVFGSAEYVFKKDGSIIKGKILRDENLFLTIRSEDGKTERIGRKEIMRVLYTNLNMGKIYVQKRNGESLKVYMVDEDRDTYTFRYVIDNSDEFKVKRSDILFIAERNPSGLRGTSGYTDILLEWYPPIDKMKYFNVYIKTKNDDKYSIAGSSKENLYKLKNLTGNMKYYILVTGVDESGSETTPSNELQISTLNLSPDAPGGIRVIPQGDDSVTIKWQAAEDPDGVVVKYRIYTFKDDKKILVGETTELAFTINGIKSADRVMVNSVDDAGAESSTESMRSSQVDSMRLCFSPVIIYPLGDFGEMGEAGYGGLFLFMKYNVLFKGSAAGLESGYFYIPGRNSIETEGQNVHRFQIFPALIKTGYIFTLSENLVITPSFSAGVAYVDLTYTSRDRKTSVDTEKELKGFDLLAVGNMSLDYSLSDNMFIGFTFSYGALIESKKNMQFAVCGINSGLRF